MATGTIILPVQSAKISGAFVTNGLVSQGASIVAADGAWKLLFDTTTAEGAVWQFKMPVNYASGLTSKIQYSMASATSGTLAIDLAIMAVADGEDIDVASFDTVNTTTAITVQGTAGFVDTITTALTTADSVAADELVVLQVSRDVAADSALGDAEVLAIALEYTTV